MTINVSVLSHAFFTEKGTSIALAGCNRDPCSVHLLNDLSDQPADMKVDYGVGGEFAQTRELSGMCPSRTQDVHAVTTPRTASSCMACRDLLMSPRSVVEASSSPRLLTTASPSPRGASAAGGGKTHGKKKGNKKRGARGRHSVSSEPKEAKLMQALSPEMATRSLEGPLSGMKPSNVCCCINSGSVSDVGMMGPMETEVVLRELRDECSSALGIAKEDLELYGLCHLPHSLERATLLKDKSGVIHLGVVVRNSDLNLRSIEELVIRKDKAEQDAESYRLQVNEKTQDFQSLKLKYDKLTEEVLRLRTMVNRANHLRRESEKATEILRVEFEKLVKTLFIECSPEASQHNEGEENQQSMT